MRLNLISLLVLSLVTISAAFADGNYTCTSNIGLTNQLTVQGVGTAAKIHIENVTMSGDLTYNDAYTKAAGQAGYDIFMGTITDKLDTPPTQFVGAFLFQPALLNGENGTMEQFAQDSFLVLNCVKAQ